MNGRQAKRLRKQARQNIGKFNSDGFIFALMKLSFWKRLKFCISVMVKK